MQGGAVDDRSVRLRSAATFFFRGGGRASAGAQIVMPSENAMPMTQPEVHTRMPSLSGRRVLISGGTTGLGRAMANLLGAEGARIFTFGRHQPELADALRDIRATGAEAEGITADAARPEDLRRVFECSDRFLGGLDVLIANAALGAEGVADMREQDWRYVIETNVCGYIGCVQLALERMRPRRQGHLVLIGSISADTRSAGSSIYVATKSAIQGFAEALRKEVNPEGIKVSLIEPGAVGSDMQDESPAEQREKISRKEMLRAEDIAVCVHYVLTQPARCDVTEVQIRPHLQII